jgi:diaminopimelate epimerase
MLHFVKAHAYGNDFLYVNADELPGLAARDEDAENVENARNVENPESARMARLAMMLCDRHAGVGADGLILYTSAPGGASMRLFNADGSPSEVSGNGVRGLATILLRADDRAEATVVVHTSAGPKALTRTARDGGRQTFVAAMGAPRDLRQVRVVIDGEELTLSVMDFGNPQCVVLGPLPDRARFERLGRALERHPLFPARTNVEFAFVEAPGTVRILIWERGVGPTMSSGTGSCAALIAAAAYGGAARSAQVFSPGGVQQVDWRPDGVYLTGWAEVVFEGTWEGTLEAAREAEGTW